MLWPALPQPPHARAEPDAPRPFFAGAVFLVFFTFLVLGIVIAYNLNQPSSSGTHVLMAKKENPKEAKKPNGTQYSIYLSDRQCEQLAALTKDRIAKDPYVKRSDVIRQVFDAGLIKLGFK